MKQSKSSGAATAKWVGVAVAVGLVLVISLTGILQSQKDAREKAAKWETPGPACQQLAALPPGERMSTNVTEVEGAQFRRSSGHVACTQVGADHGKSDAQVPICQFSSPSVVEVKTAKGTFYFAPGPGLPATVAVRDGQPECAAAGNTAVFND